MFSDDVLVLLRSFRQLMQASRQPDTVSSLDNRLTTCWVIRGVVMWWVLVTITQNSPTTLPGKFYVGTTRGLNPCPLSSILVLLSLTLHDFL